MRPQEKKNICIFRNNYFFLERINDRTANRFPSSSLADYTTSSIYMPIRRSVSPKVHADNLLVTDNAQRRNTTKLHTHLHQHVAHQM